MKGEKFQHAISGDCPSRKYPDPEPVRIREEFAREEHCCYCSIQTRFGIYVRDDPKNTICQSS
jgi:hypothetical protein